MTDQWICCKKNLPIPYDLYWITDCKDFALARFITEDMQWKFEYHWEIFKPVYMLKVVFPPLPKE